HYPIYRLIGLAVTRVGSDEEMVATQKAVGGLALYPLTWIVCAALAWWRFGWPTALAVLVILPVLGYIALRFFEQLDGVIVGARQREAPASQQDRRERCRHRLEGQHHRRFRRRDPRLSPHQCNERQRGGDDGGEGDDRGDVGIDVRPRRERAHRRGGDADHQHLHRGERERGRSRAVLR